MVNKHGIESVQFTADRIVKCVDGSLNVSLLGIKNDYSREGFVVNVQQSSEEKLYPVAAVKELLHRTWMMNPDPKGLVFTPLNYPYSSLAVSSIAKVLNKAIDLAGLKKRGFSAKSFRPTGATSAIEQGVDADIIQKTGCWRSQECFRDHYVHSVPPRTMSDKILLS